MKEYCALVRWNDFEQRAPLTALILSVAGAAALASLVLGLAIAALWVALSALSYLL